MSGPMRTFVARSMNSWRRPAFGCGFQALRLSSTASSPKPPFTSPALISSLCAGLILGFGASQLLPSDKLPVKPAYGTPKDFDKAIEELRTAFLTREGVVSTNSDDLAIHGLSTNTYHTGVPHSVVVYPESTEDVVQIVKIANKYKMPMIPYSGGTALEGQFIGNSKGGICVDVSSMNRILEIHESDADVVCQAGVSWVELNETLKEKGIPLFFPIDPALGATIGGMASTGCSGTNAVRYGTAKAEWFLNLTVVLPNGQVIKTRRRSRKSSAGFDTTKLFIGAEGTLGIITEATIRLAPVMSTTVASVQFPDVKCAVEASIEILRSGVAQGIRKPRIIALVSPQSQLVAECVELVDDAFLDATNKYGASSHKYVVSDGLFFKFQGANASVLSEVARTAKQICLKHQGIDFRLAKNDNEAEDIWADRKNAHHIGLSILPGSKGLATDVCVPVSQLPTLVLETKADLIANGIPYTMVGHVGDGNFHTLMLSRNAEEFAKVHDAAHRMVERAIKLDGTCTGEHGVGVGKREFLVEELGAGTVALMKSIKSTIDPLGLMNPGKLYPDDEVVPKH
ncbi:FAD-binding protein [Mycena indigotica]|uniref:D-lactate dehydrogenase (cytochrome) n=1 Tax=Mycena indigotica TaxID=2126181 RepID=A0A8H6SQU7_9AGAR|nr:FAD-binding protein [Mycena indigotica]KAF7303816.1 FAD-binding protein [Mycena indigotica]